ncbi:sensor histidine kinase [Taibaiella soli]|uniref:Uncharacterized protein n=1 Tax=Taibaiella soli TaxID=1649169 RepID=A0A2W2BFX5_9BACT|nr:histidine kinase [Taibaiella soli]PZF74807.1 hypothetical protein DN068_01010 [Taibaiella soli]
MSLKLDRLLYLLLFLFFFTVQQGGAQSYPMRNYTAADGLPSNTIYYVFKDSRGILWFGSDKGIARYNGVRFEKFSTADGLPDNEIFGFCEDKYHRLWMSTFNGSLCYYKDGIIHTAANTPFLKLPVNYAMISSIYNEYDGTVTICFSGSNYFLNINNERITTLNITPFKRDTRRLKQIVKLAPAKYHVYYDSTGVIWDTAGKTATTPMTDFWAGFISNGQRYLISGNEIYHNDSPICHIPRHDSLKVFSVLEDNAFNRVMMGTSRGLFVFPGDTILFRNSEVSSITKDTVGNYWITTTNAGIFCMAAGDRHFGIFNNPEKGRVRYAHVVNHQLYFTTENGNIYTLIHDTVRKLHDAFQYKDEFIKNHPSFDIYNIDFMPEQRISMTGTRRRAIENRAVPYVSYLDDSLHFYHFTSWDNIVFDQLQTGKAHVARALPFTFSGSYKNIAVTKDAIYIKAYMDILYIPKTSMETQNCQQVRLLKAEQGKHDRLFGWAKDAAGDVWFSTVDSLYKLDKDKMIVQPQFGAIGLRKFTFLNGFIIGYKHNNTLLIAHLNQQKKLITDTTINPNSILDDFYQIDGTHIVISSSDKYYMVALTQPGQKSGFSIQTVASRFLPPQAEYICADSGVCYFFKNGTITRFDSKRLFNPLIKPVVYFISLQTKQHFYAANQNAISIPYSETGDVQVSYMPLSYSGGDLQCQYSISQDSSNEWHVIDESNIHLYLSHYGTYNIRIRAKALSDVYSDIATFQLTILKPFWATWWFILTVIVAAVALIWWITLSFARNLLRKKQRAYDAEMKYQRMEFKALNALMNPHFIFNTLNNIQNLFKNQQNKADEYFVTFSRLIRQNMQNVTKDTISLEQELNLVVNYLKLEKLRFDEFVNYIVDVDPDLDLDNVFIPPLLIQPLVENAIRHGLLPKQSTSNLVTVKVHEKDKSLFIEIEDNGVGLSNNTSHIDPQHESLGLSNLKKRIEHMNRTHNYTITFTLTEQTDKNGKVKGTLALVEISSERW